MGAVALVGTVVLGHPIQTDGKMQRGVMDMLIRRARREKAFLRFFRKLINSDELFAYFRSRFWG